MDYSYFSSVLNISILGGLSLILIVSSILSYYEREFNAGNKLLATSVLVILSIYFIGFYEYQGKIIVSILLSLLTLIIVYLFLKRPIQSKAQAAIQPIRNIDEHDIVFARMKLKPDSPDWDDYYSKHQQEAEQDAIARNLPGLFSEKSQYYNPLTFTSSDINFDIIEYLHKAIKHPISNEIINIKDEVLTNYLKNWAKYLGVHSLGITELKDYHLYTVKGRGEDKGKPILRNHKYAIAFTVEMDLRNVSSAPASPITFETTQKYLESATIALQFSTFLKKLGYDSRAHIDGNYELICPLVARDAGLGEIGRMSLLMTPKLGPRVRIAVVTTNAALLVNEYFQNPTIIEFCKYCKKCADCCPSKSISYEDMIDSNGNYRWKVDANSCYQYWCIAGTDCGRCMTVCPFSHPNNLLHNAIRRLISRSYLMTRIAYLADDILYRRKPKPKPIPEWMKYS